MFNGQVSADEDAPRVLPAARSPRWQPLRAGLLNLYRYDEEEFHFERGRLLLRGNNGTGKSRVLALQLPFLFDADVSPHRVEPDGNPAKRIEWNLLMDRHHDRLGYTWLEFGRRDEEGTAHYVTIGIGLHAVQGRGAPAHWHFITEQRIGADLHLCNEQNQPLSRDRLTKAIGEAGEVFTTAQQYRRAVNEALFKLSDARYAALVDLLIQLRQPQLSRDLDEKRLSAALSEALPPVEPRIIADVAESFRGLDRDRVDLQRSEAAGEATEAFLREYGPYVKCAARRRAAAVRSAHARYEETQRQLKAAETQRDEAQQTVEEMDAALARLAGDIQAADAAIQTLSSSPEMRDARELETAHREAEERRRESNERTSDHQAAVQQHEQALAELARVRDAGERTASEARDGAGNAASAADRAGWSDAHASRLAKIEERLDDPAAIDDAARQVEALLQQRRAGIRRVRLLVREAQQAESLLAQAKGSLAAKQGELDDAIEDERRAADGLVEAGEALLAAYRAWAEAAVELTPTPADDLADDLALWCDTGGGRSPTAHAAESALTAATQVLAGERAAMERTLAQTRQQIEQWQQDRAALEAGRHEPPLPPYTRGPEARGETQAGAPLWSLIDFADEIGQEDRAGIEAALAAAGLLDAWVTPDGRVLDVDTLDTCLAADHAAPPMEGRSLSDVLQADATACGTTGVSERVVSAVLAKIGLDESAATTWIGTDGAWRNGPLHGRWSKSAAQHIGQAARERHRQQRLAELDARIADTRRVERDQADALARLDARAAQARQEARQAPSDDDVRQAMANRTAAAGQVIRRRELVTAAEEEVHSRRQTLEAAQAARDQDAADLGIADWIDRLDELSDATEAYGQAAVRLVSVMRRNLDAQRATRAAEQRERDLGERMRDQASKREDAAGRLRVAQARRETLEATVGQGVREIRDRLEQAKTREKALRDEQERTRDRHNEQRIQFGVAQKEIAAQAEMLGRHQEDRGAVIASFAAFVRTGLLNVAADELAGEDGEWTSVTRAVELARRLETLLADTPGDDEAWAKHERDVHKHIQALTDALLPHDLRPQTTMIDHMLVVSVLYNQRECTMSALREALAEDAQARRTLLEENERKVLEQTLIDEVATHLHGRLREAERLLATMNEQIISRPMSTGMRLKFTWDPIDDGPSGLDDARRRLLGADATWSPQERAALGRFLHQQIQAVRAGNDAATWQQQIEEAFDYRRWHRFGVMRQQDGKWQRLTRRTHGTGSGGEKAVALTLPMFAAASAHYQSADPLAPRPILLDEAFAGIDADMRGKCMGLLEAFDLDFIMTSEREWGCYAEMPGVAIYQLTTMKGNDGVLATRWLWNGRQRERAGITHHRDTET